MPSPKQFLTDLDAYMQTNEKLRNTTPEFLAGGGEMGAMIRAKDWSKTPLGSPENWPQSLRTTVGLCLSSPFPILIAWGPETIQIYNDSYRPICGAKHPESLGQNFRICWETALPVVGDAFTRGEHGEGTYIKDQRMFLYRFGYLEEAWMTFSFTPITDESGKVGGIFHPITETTDKMLSARRTQVLRDIAEQIANAKSNDDIYSQIAEAYHQFNLDLPFLLFYQLDDKKELATLKSAIALDAGSPLTPQIVNINDAGETWPLDEAIKSSQAVIVNNLQTIFGSFVCEPYSEAPATALILPVRISSKEKPFGFMIAGVSARREFDKDYANFYALLANTINTAFSNVYAYEQERKRAEALAEIDRAKTTFFSNISHEFRTPLTLMLGPIEDALHNPESVTDNEVRLDLAYRNGLRLQKLVNTLLEFSRIEAGRIEGRFVPVDICAFTTDLASTFRSAVERAGMTLEINCGKIEEQVYVDTDMWEKIVLNLLSNAFKYSNEGSIEVAINHIGNEIHLSVKDTGVGIPRDQLDKIFSRFHRVENTGGRSQEGTGIGLAMVKELVKQHGGTVTVESTIEKGSEFTVSIPIGKEHLQGKAVGNQIASAGLSGQSEAYVQEALKWLPERGSQNETRVLADDMSPSITTNAKQQKVLLADDNADMREYITRLLSVSFVVITATNGEEAAEKAIGDFPDLILTDVMMPKLDGFGLLKKLKESTATSNIPVIFLSARAGEDAKVEGLEAGADDYLVKPFSAKELMAKVESTIKIAQARKKIATQLRNFFSQAPAGIGVVRGPQYVWEIANKRMLELIGREKEEEVLDKPLFESIPEGRGQGFEEIFATVYQTGKRLTIDEIPVEINRYGQPEKFWIKAVYEPLREEDGSISGIMILSDDVTEQVTALKLLEESEVRYRSLSESLEQQVMQRTAELQRSNEDLQQFAHVASHDLKEPVRKIKTFSSRLESELGKSLNEKGRLYLSKVHSATDRIFSMIEGVLNYSATNALAQALEQVDLEEVMKSIETDLEILIQQTGATIKYRDLPTLEGAPVLLYQLFYNLINNSLKFISTGVRPHITITSHAIFKNDKLSAKISVRDNGIGFAQEQAKKIFDTFIRLNSKDKYNGTGLGLALCKKIAERHGGTIEANSIIGEGAEFMVTLPLKQSENNI